VYSKLVPWHFELEKVGDIFKPFVSKAFNVYGRQILCPCGFDDSNLSLITTKKATKLFYTFS